MWKERGSGEGGAGCGSEADTLHTTKLNSNLVFQVIPKEHPESVTVYWVFSLVHMVYGPQILLLPQALQMLDRPEDRKMNYDVGSGGM